MSYYKSKEENSPFLYVQKPVSLTPAWEDQKLPNDELNFKDVNIDKPRARLNPPKDKLQLVFLIFLLHGIGTLMPWNMFITAKSYFVDFKLATNVTDSSLSSSYAGYFLQYLGFASQIPNFIFSWLNLFVHFGGDLTKRIIYSIIVALIIFAITVFLAMLDTSSWPNIFFWITMISVVLMNMANGVYQNTIYGIAATLPARYTGAVVLGSNISGLFTSIVSIFSSYIFSSYRTSAIYYFITAMIVLLLCLDTYFALPLNKFYRFHEMLRRKEDKTLYNKELLVVPYLKIFRQAFPQLLNVFFVFFVTLAVFPAVHSDIKPSSTEFFLPYSLFTPITCFLTFNLFAMLGSLTTSFVQWPVSQYLWIPVFMRAAFLPLFLFCNYLPQNTQRNVPVLITNDWIYWFIAILMSYSSGYLSSLGMMYAPQMVAPKYQTTAGMFAAAILITGIFAGILFSFLFPKMVML